ncbi:cytochrome p450 [Moniliophthora roreri]|uniref:Cytochrome p450 n=1 Tax=Moniliophthora roreri TaxID=221103 RepID=A0A0W0FAG4_MONRR|nr:cytochrome p450 [Moniliophthora roreri]
MTFWVGTKGEEELDHIIGDQRASALHDLEKTPYIQAIFKETICIRPVGPVGIPHTTTSTEEFRGYVLPEGTAIFSDTYGIFHDPEHGTKLGMDDSAFQGHTASIVFSFGWSLTLTPKPFQCRIIPHGEHVKNIIESELCASTEIFIQFERDLVEEDKQWVDEIRSGW